MRHCLLPDAKRSPHYGAVLFVLVLLIVVAPLSSGDESRLVGLHIHGQRPNDGGVG